MHYDDREKTLIIISLLNFLTNSCFSTYVTKAHYNISSQDILEICHIQINHNTTISIKTFNKRAFVFPSDNKILQVELLPEDSVRSSRRRSVKFQA